MSKPFKMKGWSPFTQKKEKKNSELILSRATDIVDPSTRKMTRTENMQSDDESGNYRIPVTKSTSKKNFGLYVTKDKDGNEVVVNPRDESVVPRSLLDTKGEEVRPGGDQQRAIRKYKSGN
jgi:hypothetical protein